MMRTLQSYSGLRQSGETRKIQSLVRAFLWAWVLCGVGGECPKVCECKWKDGKETVSCIGAEFIDIPRQLDPSTQVLDLKHNNLQILPRDAFVDTGLVNLQKLWLNHCNLKHMDRGAFNMLANLVELDLSHNLLRLVPTAALIDISGLRELRLASNALTSIPADAFAPTPDLVHLDLSSNRIQSVDPKAFRCLSTLEILKLSSNMLVHLMHELLVPLKALHGLNLNDNPWNCDCRLRPLRQWMLDHNIAGVVPPHCNRPRRLKGRSWQNLGLDEFVCVPEVTAVAPRVLSTRGENVSLVCRVQTDTEASVTWLFGDQPLEKTSEGWRYHVLDIVTSNKTMLVSNLTIVKTALKDQGAYACIAENKAGRSESNLTLQVSSDISEVRLVSFDRAYMTGGLLCGLGMLVTILLLVSCIIHRRQRVRRFRRQEEDREGRVVQPTCSKAPKPAVSTQRKPSEYHVIPSGESEAPQIHPLQKDQPWRSREVVNGGYPSFLENGIYDDSILEKYRDDLLDDLRDQQVSPGVTPYIDLPPADVSRRRSELGDKESLKNLEFETDILRRECSPTGSTVSVVSSGHLSDILGLPYSRRLDHQGFQSDFNSVARKHRPLVYDDRRHDRLTYDPSTLNARCYSALNLATSEAAARAFNYPRRRAAPRYPSLPCTPMLDHDDRLAHAHAHDARRLRRLLAANSRGVYRSLEGTGELSDSYRYQYHAAQLENYLKEYRSLQGRLYRMKTSPDPAHRSASASRRFSDKLEGLGHDVGTSLTHNISGSLSHTGSLTQDVTSGFTRDITGSLSHDITSSLSRTGSLTTGGLSRDISSSLSRTGSLTRDITDGLSRDISSSLSRTSSLTRNVTGSLSCDVASSLARDVRGGVGLFPDTSSPPSPYLDMEVGLPRRRSRAATEPLLDVSPSAVLGRRKASLGIISGGALGRTEAIMKGRTLGPSDPISDALHGRATGTTDSMMEAVKSRALGTGECVRSSRGLGPSSPMMEVRSGRSLSTTTDSMVDVTPGEPQRSTEPLRSILKNRYEGGGLLYQGQYTNSAYYDDDDEAEGAFSPPSYSPTQYKDFLDHGS